MGIPTVLGHGAFIGSETLRVTAGPFSIGAYPVGPQPSRLPSHGHSNAHFMFAIGGEYFSEAERADAGRDVQLIYNPAQVFHRDQFRKGPASFVSLSIDDSLADALAEWRAPTVPIAVVDAGVRRAWNRLLAVCAQGLGPAEIDVAVMELLAQFAVGPREQPSTGWLKRAKEILDEAPTMAIRDVAKEVGIHPFHLCRAFREAYGCSPTAFRSQRRLESAMAAMTSSRRLGEIAQDAGYFDQSHLVKEFRGKLGVAPSKFSALLARPNLA
ncbi:MAG: helix-turn-helix transcriptional regulator [Armatimonadetes bacterium]|nr:helix-turn-helix transcriptional regulator [Armatimonadota bacterium]